MTENIRILIVDDHPMTIIGYQMLLEEMEMDYSFESEGALDCDSVIEKMNRNKNNFFDVVLLDIRLPASADKSIVNGEDLGKKIRSEFPSSKIIVHTSIYDKVRISSILKILNPEGFLIKNDIEPDVLKDALNSVLKGYTYYSEKTNRIIGVTHKDEIFLDTSDLKIIYHLSIGELTKNLPKYVPLAIATIERRKKRLKMLFDIPNGGDKEIIEIAKLRGYI
jgi:DNA-binding NarL/FixJ family response regulator